MRHMGISSNRSDENMDSIYPHFTVRTLFSLILLIVLQPAAEATICSAPSRVEFPENNEINAVVVTINVEPNVTLEFNPPPANPENPFELHENSMTANRVLDYETKTTYVAQMTCKQTTTGLTVPITVVVLIINENDNPPVFDQNVYNAEVSEMASIGAIVGVFPATDLDKPSQLYYVLTSESNYFGLQSATNPTILVEARLDYEKVRNVQLVLEVQDTPLTLVNSRASFTATTTIEVTILDGDNRPPWFQPCTTLEVGGAVICQSSGYTGRVVLNEQEPGALPLKPGPLYAIDGDAGINEEITYSFLSGNDDGLFEIGPNTGNITMLKPTDVLGTISLTVLATQKVNNHQFATTTVTISVQVKSLYPPKFQKSQYEGVISSVGTMAVDIANKDQPLRIIATDQDYSATEGLNPHITYSVKGSSDFSIINGYLFMTKDLPEGILSLEMLAVDSTNDESDTALLSVEVKSGLTTSSLPLSTTDFITTIPISESTTMSSISTTSPSESTISITNSGTLTPEESVSTPSKAPPVISSSGEYGVAEMAALGATLAALLLICLVIIGVLAHRMQRGKADWRKIYEASIFRSSLGQGPGGQKEGIQYTNEAFQNDDDEGSMGSSGPERRRESTQKPVWDIPNKGDHGRSSAPLNALLPDDTSDVGSDKADSEKDVKPILTKERRMEEGYKSVWFKADIDPNAKEEVVIIPDREEDSEEEHEKPSSSSRQNDQDGKPQKTNKVLFTDTDLDSGLGVKIGELGDDSDTDEAVNIDL